MSENKKHSDGEVEARRETCIKEELGERREGEREKENWIELDSQG